MSHLLIPQNEIQLFITVQGGYSSAVLPEQYIFAI